jgi:small subunit ribosomal protein S6e
MKQGVLHKGRVRLLFSQGHTCFRIRRDGEKKRKSVRGCIVGPDIRVLALAIVRKGDADLAGITDKQCPRTLGPKRVNRIRKLFALKKDDGIELVKKAAVRRTFQSKATNKKRQKAPKIQRLITEERLRRKRSYRREKKGLWDRTKKAHETYDKMVIEWNKKKASGKHAVEAVKPATTAATTKTATTKTATAAKTTGATKVAPAKVAPAKVAPATKAPAAKTTAPAAKTTAPAATTAKTTTAKPAVKK